MNKIHTAIIVLLLLCLPHLSYAHDVFYPTGTYYHGETVLRMEARGVPKVLERSYRSNRIVKRSPDSQTRDFKRPVDGPLGFGWHTPFTVRIDNGDTYVAPDGRTFTFDKDDSGTLKPDYANGNILTASSSGFQLQEIGGNSSTFDITGRLLTITDSQWRSAILGYCGDQLATIKDSAVAPFKPSPGEAITSAA